MKKRKTFCVFGAQLSTLQLVLRRTPLPRDVQRLIEFAAITGKITEAMSDALVWRQYFGRQTMGQADRWNVEKQRWWIEEFRWQDYPLNCRCWYQDDELFDDSRTARVSLRFHEDLNWEDGWGRRTRYILEY